MPESSSIQDRIGPSETLDPSGSGESSDGHLTRASCSFASDALPQDRMMPFRATQFYYDQIRRGPYFDQLRHIVEPSSEELDSPGRWDTSGEREHTVVTGLQHKYPQTALLLVTMDCFAHCRFCFRRRLLETSSNEIATDFSQAAAYIRQHGEISNVLLSGGDPFTLSTERLRDIVARLLPIPHLKSIRFGTKGLVFSPARFGDRQLHCLFEEILAAGRTPVVVTHIDHLGEISEETELRIRELQARGVQIFNQAVLLRKVNDDPESLASTFHKLTAIGVRPYYLFQARPTLRASRFQVTLRRGVEIVRAVHQRLSGLEKTSRYVMSHETGKIEILGFDQDNRLVMRYHQATDPQQTGLLFSRAIPENACWLEDLPEGRRE